MHKNKERITVGILGAMAELYARMWGEEFQNTLEAFLSELGQTISACGLEVHQSPIVSTQQDVRRAIDFLSGHNVDLTLVVLALLLPQRHRGVRPCRP